VAWGTEKSAGVSKDWLQIKEKGGEKLYWRKGKETERDIAGKEVVVQKSQKRQTVKAKTEN